MPKSPRIARRRRDRPATSSSEGRHFLVPIAEVTPRRAVRSTARLGIPRVVPLVEGPGGSQLVQIQASDLSRAARRRAYTRTQPEASTSQLSVQDTSNTPVDPVTGVVAHEWQGDEGNHAQDAPAPAASRPRKKRTDAEHLKMQAEKWTKDMLPLLLQPFLEYLERFGSSDVPRPVSAGTCTCGSRGRTLHLLVLYFNSSSRYLSLSLRTV